MVSLLVLLLFFEGGCARHVLHPLPNEECPFERSKRVNKIGVPINNLKKGGEREVKSKNLSWSHEDGRGGCCCCCFPPQIIGAKSH